MASSTLFKYFKQPTKPCEEESIPEKDLKQPAKSNEKSSGNSENAAAAAAVENSVKRKSGAASEVQTGKRRKLSLANIREKQKRSQEERRLSQEEIKLSPVSPVGQLKLSPEVVSCKAAEEEKEVLEVRKYQQPEKENSPEEVKLIASPMLRTYGGRKSKPPTVQPPKLPDPPPVTIMLDQDESSQDDFTCRVKQIASPPEIVPPCSEDSLDSSFPGKEQNGGEEESLRSLTRRLSLTDDRSCSPVQQQSLTDNRSCSPVKQQSLIDDRSCSPVKQPSRRRSSRRRFLSDSDSEAMETENTEQPITAPLTPPEVTEVVAVDSEPEPKEDQRRSSRRHRKPVLRFEPKHEVKKRETEAKTPKRSTARRKSDEVMIVETVTKPCKSVNSVLGVGKQGKQKAAAVTKPKPRISSSQMMAEARKLMAQAAPTTCTTTSTTAAMVVGGGHQQSWAGVSSTIEPVVWPRIVHVGLSPDYFTPQQRTPQEEEEEEIAVPDGLFRLRIPTESCFTGSNRSLCYDEAVEELGEQHKSADVEELVEYYRNAARTDTVESRLWQQIYCPTDHHKVLGNKGPVRQLHKWLEKWKTRLLQETKPGSSRSDSDSEEWSDGSGSEGEGREWLDNLVLLTGPTGSGKSGAIATCSRQLGFKVLECNASSERTGKQLGEMFSEASQSHSVTGKTGTADFTSMVNKIVNRQSQKKGALDKFLGGKKKKEGAQLGKTPEGGKGGRRKKKSRDHKPAVVATSKVEKLTMIVIEEVDVIFEDDRGFLAAIVALASIAKRPIILTSTTPNINLPTDSEFLILGFQPPRLESILLSMGALLLSHTAHISAYQLQQYTRFHSCNPLHLLSNLQFVQHRPLPPSVLQRPSLTHHHLGTSPSLTCRRTFLAQVRSLHLLFTPVNLEKLLKRVGGGDHPRRNVLESLVCRDTFLALDHLEGRVEAGVAIEDQLLTVLGVGQINDSQLRLNEHKHKELRRQENIDEAYTAARVGLGLLSSRPYEELAAVRAICTTERVREESGSRRRFSHYLKSALDCKNREYLSKLWLGGE